MALLKFVNIVPEITLNKSLFYINNPIYIYRTLKVVLKYGKDIKMS